MQALDNYILERLNPRNLGPKFIFSVDKPVDEIVKDLKNIGLTQMPFIDKYKKVVTGEKQMVADMDDISKPAFITDSNSMLSWIILANTTKNEISEDNPMFYYDEGQCYHIIYFNGNQLKEFSLSKNEWLDKVNKIFKF